MKTKSIIIRTLSISLSLLTSYTTTSSVCLASDYRMFMPGMSNNAQSEEDLLKKRLTSAIKNSLRVYPDFSTWYGNSQPAVADSVTALQRLDRRSIPDDFPLKKFVVPKKEGGRWDYTDCIDLWHVKAENMGLTDLVKALAWIQMNVDTTRTAEINEGIARLSNFLEEFVRIGTDYYSDNGLQGRFDSLFPALCDAVYRIVRASNNELQLAMMWKLERNVFDPGRVARVLRNANTWLPVCMAEYNRLATETAGE